MSERRNDSLPSLLDGSDLFDACVRGDVSLIERSLSALTSTQISSIRDENRASLLHYACRYGHENLLAYFVKVKGMSLTEIRTEHGATCLHDAAVCDQVNILHFLFSNERDNVRWTCRDEQGNTPLHLGRLSLFCSSTRRPVDPLLLASAYNSLKVIDYLLQRQLIDPHDHSYQGFQSIHYACAHGHLSAAELLLDSAGDTINSQTNQLSTPIHLATETGSLQLIQLLVGRGANLQLKDLNGLNALHIGQTNTRLVSLHASLRQLVITGISTSFAG